MANIRDFIEKIGIARYGNDVRSSIMNALIAVNDESEKSVLLVNQSVEKANEASNVALEASNTANDLTSRAEIVIVEAEQSASDAEQSSIQAGEKAELAERNAKISQSYAVGGTGTRENEDIDNAMYYYMQAKHISQGNNGLVPMGTITFEELPISDITQNAMYNISNAFTSDERFLDGCGLNYGAGSNVYYTVNGKWDVLAASSVNGVKGNKESEYRQGNVNITPENIGALPEDGNAVSATKATQDSNGNNIVETYRTKTGDTADNVVSFASGDSENPTGWEDINVVESGETHGSLFRKISLAIKNLRYLYNMIGTDDIAAIGDGTIKGAITGLNNNLNGFDISDTKLPSGTSLGEFCTMLANKFYPKRINILNQNIGFGSGFSLGLNVPFNEGYTNSGSLTYSNNVLSAPIINATGGHGNFLNVPIDLSYYSKLHIVGYVDSTEYKEEIDVSQLSGEHIISIASVRDYGWGFDVNVCSSQGTYLMTNSVGRAYCRNTSVASTVYIKELYLE